jgi:dolichol-phosphate mannosyltransferase
VSQVPGGADTLVVIPTYQEAENIREVLTRVRAAVPDAHILVVDGTSPDGTADLARSLGAELGNIDVLDAQHAAGLGGAYRAGFRLGLERGYGTIVEMDADLSHDPEAIPTLLSTLHETQAALVIGSRYVPGGSIPNWSRHRQALSRWGNRYAAFVLGISVSDATSGYRVYRAETLEQAGYDTTTTAGYGFQIELAYRVSRTGGGIAEVPIRFVDRVRGNSKMTTTIAVEALGLVTWWGIRDRSRDLYRRVRGGSSTPPETA